MISHDTGAQSQSVAALMSLGAGPASPLSKISRGYGRSSKVVSTSIVGNVCSKTCHNVCKMKRFVVEFDWNDLGVIRE